MRILVIEDQADIRQALVQMLREEGYATDSSADGEEGLYKALNWDYDIIVLDVMLPILDGWEVLCKLRARKETPVLMLTALDTIQDRIRGLNKGADDYLPKPFDMHELLARIGAITRRQGGNRNPRITIGNVTLDTVQKKVFVDDEDVKFTALEYATAEILITRRNEVVTRDFLYEHLFDENDESMSNMLDVYIYKIRKSMGKNFIKTRRGQGYIVESLD